MEGREEIENKLKTLSKDFGLAEEDIVPLSHDSLQKWKTFVQAKVAKIGSAIKDKQIEELTIEWWKLWQTRISKFLDFESIDLEINSLDFLCHAAGKELAGLLKLRLNKMTLSDWSKILLLSLKDQRENGLPYAPFWLSFPALYKLGLGRIAKMLIDPDTCTEIISIYKKRKNIEEDFDIINRWVKELSDKLNVYESNDIGLILAKNKNSVTSNWETSKRFGCCIFQTDEIDHLKDIVHRFGNIWKRKLPLDDGPSVSVLVEIGEGQTDANVALSNLPFATPQKLALLVSEYADEMDVNWPVIRAPQSLDDAMDRIMQMTENK
jgi:hypothetical protein